MKSKLNQRMMKCVASAAVASIFAAIQLSSCVGFIPPPIPVTLELSRDVQISALAAASGSADVSLGAICGLFNDAELDAMVREAAGPLIPDLVTVTRVMLVSTDVQATEGNFDPFETAVLDLTIEGSGGETLLLGTAANNEGLGTAFSLRLNSPVDLLNDLEADECGSPTLHLDGGGFLEAGAITFDVHVKLLVYTEVRAVR